VLEVATGVSAMTSTTGATTTLSVTVSGAMPNAATTPMKGKIAASTPRRTLLLRVRRSNVSITIELS
jgi:hypothetical protein